LGNTVNCLWRVRICSDDIFRAAGVVIRRDNNRSIADSSDNVTGDG